jgi:hypothetical protein
VDASLVFVLAADNIDVDAFSLDTSSDGNAEWTRRGRLVDVVPGRGW